MKKPMRFPLGLIASIVLLIQPALRADPAYDDRKVKDTVDGELAVADGKLVRSAGDQIKTHGKPFDIVASPDGSLLFVKADRSLDIIDSKTFTSRQQLNFDNEEKESGSMYGMAVAAKKEGGFTLYFSSTGKSMLVADVKPDGRGEWSTKVSLGGTFNLGIALSPDNSKAYICMSARNALGVVDLSAGKLIGEIPVGVAPYGVALSPDGKHAFVSNFGGHPPAANHAQAESVGTEVSLDDRDIPDSGTVSDVDLADGKVEKEIKVGLHPTQIVRSAAGDRYYVADANSDTVSVIDPKSDSVVQTISVHPDAGLPFGSIPDGLSLSGDGKTLYVANSGNNAVAVIPVGSLSKTTKPSGFIPTGWFPGGVTCVGDQLYVANAKSGSVSRIPVPTAGELTKYTAQSMADARVPQVLKDMERGKGKLPPVPVPTKQGEPSVFKHVVYVLKENKTYDQVLGDIGKGNSNPKMCVYGNEVTPNHHALASQFVLLDNYYCNGVNSSDGHQWATQGIIGEYFEKGARTYDFGTDALCYAGSDFIWNSVLLHGLTFRNYGEFDFPESTPKKLHWFDVYQDWDKSGQQMFKQSLQLPMLMRYTCHQYPGWNLDFPDVCRTKVFLAEIANFEKRGEFPDFTLVYLPQDHTSGTGPTKPTPRAMVADNDLAVGQVVQAISHSKFWKDTVIFINEDDPQSGVDHVDGHRSFCLIASPYTKRGQIISHFYNQTSVLHTMTRILGLPSLNQACADSPTMEDCFTSTPDLKPYDLIKNNIPLDEHNKPKQAMVPEERALADAVDKMDFEEPDEIDDDKLNRLNWFAAGKTDPYPAEYAGAHGKGLAALHLKLESSPIAPKAKADDDDDDDVKKK